MVSPTFVVVLGATLPLVSARCQWAVLRDRADTYLYSQETGEIDEAFVAAAYRENGKPLNITTGMVSKPLKIEETRSIFDQDECKTYTEIVVTDAAQPYVIGTQISYTEQVDTSTVLVATVDSVVTTTGDLNFNASRWLEHFSGFGWGDQWPIIAEAKRDSRDVVKKIVDTYLDALAGSSTAAPVFAADCTKQVGSELAASCADGLPVPAGMGSSNAVRQYVFEDSLGAISVLVRSAEDAVPESFLFRVEDGKLKHILSLKVLRS